MYRGLAILYLSLLFCYILFSRVPDYFDGEFTPGEVVQNRLQEKQVRYVVGRDIYTVPISGWGASEVASGQKVTVIYNPTVPKEGALYTFFAYWFTLNELLASAGGFIVLYVVAVVITGKNSEEPDAAPENFRKRKYND